MLGAIAGDVIGSVFESTPTKSKDFPLFSRSSTFTDDSVLTIAVADALLNQRDYAATFRDYFHRHSDRGYGLGFQRWALWPESEPYYSYGNGSAMRVSPVAWALDSLEAVLGEARRSAEVTHNHVQGIRGAQAVAAAVFLARSGADKDEIRRFIESSFGYDLGRSLDEIRPEYAVDVSCDGSVPESIIAFLESTGFEDAVRNAVSLGGDSDTMACISGAIAEAYYGQVPESIRAELVRRLPLHFRTTVTRFTLRFMHG